MKISNYVSAVAFLAAVSAAPAVFAQTAPCMPLAPGMTPPPGVVACPSTAPSEIPVSGSFGEGSAHENANGQAGNQHTLTGFLSGNTLRVTAISKGGKLQVGTPLVGVNIPANSEVKALGSGKGGVGTYTIGAAAAAGHDRD